MLATTSWTGGSWTEGKVAFTIPANTPCGGCPTRGVPIRIELEDSSGSGGSTAQFDDTYLHHAPAIAPIGNLALGPNQTTNNVTYAFAGRVSPNALWDSGIVSFSSSNPTVVPVADISVARPDSQWEHHWTVTVDSGAATGVSTVTMNVTDPATGITTSRPFQVTVS